MITFGRGMLRGSRNPPPGGFRNHPPRVRKYSGNINSNVHSLVVSFRCRFPFHFLVAVHTTKVQPTDQKSNQSTKTHHPQKICQVDLSRGTQYSDTWPPKTVIFIINQPADKKDRSSINEWIMYAVIYHRASTCIERLNRLTSQPNLIKKELATEFQQTTQQ